MLRRAAIDSIAPVAEPERDQAGRLVGQAVHQRAAHLERARVRGRDRQDAGRRGLGSDHAERLGVGRREDERVAGRDELPDLRVLEPAGERDRPRGVPRVLGVVRRRVGEERREVLERLHRPALERAPAVRDLPGALDVALARAP